MNIDFNKNSLARTFFCLSVKNDFDDIDKLNFENDGVHDIIFTVDGIEFNFENIIDRIDNMFDGAVEKRANEILESKIDVNIEKVEEEFEKLRDRVENIRRKNFPKAFNYEDD